MQAFITHTALPLARAVSLPSSLCAHSTPVLHNAACRSATRMTAPAPDPIDIDYDAIKTKAVDTVTGAVSDVTTRPVFYSKILAYALGGLVAFTVLRAVVSAVDSIPVLPGALELIGLGYTVWFVWRYVLFKESREELLEEIEDFLGRAKPGAGV